jgi:hypothetical protein
MENLTVQIDDKTVRRVRAFAESADITTEEAATRLLRIAATVRELMHETGLLDGELDGEFLVSFEARPDGIRSLDIRPAS